MAKVSIADAEHAPQRDGVANVMVSAGSTRALFDRPGDPIHAHLHTLDPQARLEFAPNTTDRVAYVWHGSAQVGAIALEPRSSVIIEHGATGVIDAGENGATVLVFSSASSIATRRGGGSLHVLPASDVPRFQADNGLTGALHADGACATCSVWLHENGFSPMSPTATEASEAAEAGIHCHSESEVIFVTAGSMRLGRRLVGPGTAIAIAADVMYSFLPGPDGLHFLNFRAEQPTDIRFKNGHVMDEVAYWRDRVPAPVYR